jgi:hypothetical protein
MPDTQPIIDRIAACWSDLARQSVIDAVSEDSSANYYAAGFWLFYVDYTLFGVPCFALNTEENLIATDPSHRWCPPEWLIDVHPCYEKVEPLYTELSEMLDGSPDEEWETAIDQHYNAICSLCLNLTEEYHKHDGAFGTIRKNPNFIFGIFEERDGQEVYETLLDASIDPERRANLSGL